MRSSRNQLINKYVHPNSVPGDERWLYVFADISHLLKNLRMALINSKSKGIRLPEWLCLEEGLEDGHVNIDVLKDVIDIQEGDEILLAPHLDETVVNPTHFNKMKVAKQRKTSVIKNSLSLSINETFEFTVEDGTLQNTYFVIELRDSSMFPKRGSGLASILIGSSNFTKGTGMCQWEKVVSNPGERIYQWHRMLETYNKMSSSLSTLVMK